ncbi:MAG: hypothetical protein IPP99_04050 [Chitinophagaceae bacterium]|nr:hypothetical protein [Chitinophagaceae bacterium]
MSSSSGFCNKFIFDYEYFEDNSTSLSQRIIYPINTDKKRLKLKQVQQKSCDLSTSVPPYLFTYFNEQLPRRLSCGQDHWGLYKRWKWESRIDPNIQLTTIQLLQEQTGFKISRNAGGSLKEIKYPTGGSTEFNFEPNKTWVSYTAYNPNQISQVSVGYDGNQNTQYFSISFSQSVHKFKVINSALGGNAYVYSPGGTISVPAGQTMEVVQSFTPGNYSIGVAKPGASTGNGCEVFFYDMVPTPVQENRTVGGLRIQTITNKVDINANANITQFGYFDNAGKSTGILYSRPTYIQYLRNDLVGQVGFGGVYPNNNDTPTGCLNGSYLVSAGSLRPLATTQGGHIGYNEVKVSNSGNGYRFTVITDQITGIT